MNKEIKEIINFILKEGNGLYTALERGKLKEIIEEHLKYGTAMIIRSKENNEIVAVARWNWIGSSTVHILDVIIKKEHRSPRMLKYMLALGLAKNPQCRFVTYERLQKYPDREGRIFKVEQFLK